MLNEPFVALVSFFSDDSPYKKKCFLISTHKEGVDIIRRVVGYLDEQAIPFLKEEELDYLRRCEVNVICIPLLRDIPDFTSFSSSRFRILK